LSELHSLNAGNPRCFYALLLPHSHPWLSIFVIIAEEGILMRGLRYLRDGL
jgi:hypothetical protein